MNVFRLSTGRFKHFPLLQIIIMTVALIRSDSQLIAHRINDIRPYRRLA